MVCGTTSDAGKSALVTGLCRLLARRGVAVAPFKAQNMALNSYVTPDGREIGRAQGVQALAAGIEPDVRMNPILLKPGSDRTSQVIVRGRPIGTMSAVEYHDHKPALLATVLEDLASLRRDFDVVILEGAGSPTEINLLDHDIVNLRIAHEADLPAIVVGDIDRGGVFASLYGTVALLPDHLRARVRGFVINKFRGDPALLGDGSAELERRCGVPTLGVLPMVPDLALDAEDSLALDGQRVDVGHVADAGKADHRDVDALAVEPGVGVRLVTSPAQLGAPDLVVVPGSKATVADLDWLRSTGLADALASTSALVLGICGGYQMLGRSIVDDVESGSGPMAVPGLGLLDVTTEFAPTKTTLRRTGLAMGQRVDGYEIHHGVVVRGPAAAGWVHLDATGAGSAGGAGAPAEDEGAVDLDEARVLGTTVHGIFERDDFRATFLCEVGRRAGKAFVPAGVSFAAARGAQMDRLADLVETHLDVDAVLALIESARR